MTPDDPMAIAPLQVHLVDAGPITQEHADSAERGEPLQVCTMLVRQGRWSRTIAMYVAEDAPAEGVLGMPAHPSDATRVVIVRWLDLPLHVHVPHGAVGDIDFAAAAAAATWTAFNRENAIPMFVNGGTYKARVTSEGERRWMVALDGPGVTIGPEIVR